MIRDTKPQSIRQAEPLYQLLVSGSVPIYILGTNDTGRELANVLISMGRVPEAFINDWEQITEFCERPVVRTEDVPSKAMVVSCSTAVQPVTALNRLHTAGIGTVLDYFKLHLLGNGRFPPPKFCDENILDIKSNLRKYDWLASILTDEISKLTLRRLLQFRYNFDLSAMVEFRSRPDSQYFEPFIPINPQESFVDCGGCDGKTSQTFIEKFPDYRRIDYIEPDPALMSLSKKRLGSFEQIYYHEVALSREDGEAMFNRTGTGSGAIRENGQLRVHTCRLDTLLHNIPTFIKLDVEGAEIAALSGASRIISESHPALAVCVYHRQSDFWRVPEKVLSLYPKYEVFLRHYTEGIEESVMYFV